MAVKPERGRRSLDTYRQKRDPGRTPEPFTAVAATATSAARFVVQQHAARRLHWDLRLEIGGVLVSWAVPRGPAVDPKEKRLAVQTEDHPLEYADFEGLIPAGNYGAGAMIVWDNGTYHSLDGVAPADGLKTGKLDLELRGHKLRGRWALVRTKGEDGKQWLLFKKPEGSPGPEPVVNQPGSVLSGLTVTELRDGVRRDSELAALAVEAGAPRRGLPASALAPMLADTVDKPFSRPGWLFELKYDGVRVLIARQNGKAPRLTLRSGRDATATFPEIARAAAHLPADEFVIDGELIALDQRGTGSFERLQQRLGLINPWDVARTAAAVPVQVYAFDLLAAAGHDLRALPLLTRKAILSRLAPAQGVIRYADHIEHEGVAFFEAAVQHDVEGIVAKRAASPYASGRRSRDWLKIKAPKTADLAVVGFLPGKGSRAPLGALMLAWRAAPPGAGPGSLSNAPVPSGTPRLLYAGNIGSGLGPAMIDALLPRLREAVRPSPPFVPPEEPLVKGAVFVEPALVAQVRYTEVTEKGLLRQPVLEAIRQDKTIDEIDMLPSRPAAATADEQIETADEREASPPRSPSPATGEGRGGGRRPTGGADAPPRFATSNLDKVFWPAEGYTKGDLLDYYAAVWPAIAPYLRDRPVVLTRYPDGIAGKSFFQHNAPDFVPDWVPTYRIDDKDYFVLNERDALLYVINLGCIPLHMWSARASSIEHPDWAILDLDPKGAPRRDVITIARHIHAMLAPLAAPHFIKTSGQDGLHILLPLGGALTHDEATSFAEVLARLVAADLPDIATVTRHLRGRAGKVYVDYLQNGRGKTIAAPFSARPRPGAPVSTPLIWAEVAARLDPARFTIRTVPPRLTTTGDPLAGVFDNPVDVAEVLGSLRALHT